MATAFGSLLLLLVPRAPIASNDPHSYVVYTLIFNQPAPPLAPAASASPLHPHAEEMPDAEAVFSFPFVVSPQAVGRERTSEILATPWKRQSNAWWAMKTRRLLKRRCRLLPPAAHSVKY